MRSIATMLLGRLLVLAISVLFVVGNAQAHGAAGSPIAHPSAEPLKVGASSSLTRASASIVAPVERRDVVPQEGQAYIKTGMAGEPADEAGADCCGVPCNSATPAILAGSSPRLSRAPVYTLQVAAFRGATVKPSDHPPRRE